MKAAIFHGPRNVRVEYVSEPKIKGQKVLVNFKTGSICGTDLHIYRGEWRIKRGRIIGHDACGVRADTGERVVLQPVTYCGRCYFCMRGLSTYCERKGYFYGIDKNGFFAESISMPAKNLIPVPKDVSDEEAGIIEPVALAVHVMNMLKPDLQDWVTIIGQGPIGLLMTQVALLKGCKVIAIDIDKKKLQLAEKFGATECINAKEQDPKKRVKEITKRGSDFVVEAAGSPKTVEQTPHLVRKAGKVALIGEFKGFLNLERADDVSFFTTYISPVEYPIAVNLVSQKKVDVKSLITHRFKLEDFEKAIKLADNTNEGAVKVLITR